MYVRSVVPLILACLLLFAGCEKPFEPLATSGDVFSIYGHLDAAADTQWVRVMLLRESLETLPGPIDAVVTVEEIETGTTVMMSDSLSRYLSVNLGSSVYAHNFSTTIPIVPGRHYRLTATRSDGAAASGMVLIPVWQSPTLVANYIYLYPTTSIPALMNATSSQGSTIRGTRYLGMFLGSCEEFLGITRHAAFEGGDHEVRLFWVGERPSYVQCQPPRFPISKAVGPRDVGPRRVLAVASGEPWPYDPSTQFRELSHPLSISNIEGGVGFLAGVNTHIFPLDECTPLERTIPCTITFSPRSATLVGVVTNGCTGGPLPDVGVRLVGPRESGIRTKTTNVSGTVRFYGLAPGAVHSLLFETPVPPGKPSSDFFPVEVPGVVVAEATVDTVSIEMTHRRNCLP